MVKFKIPIKDILVSAYYQYELTSSDYNPTVDTTITITCTCKNIFGNPVSNKTLTLYQNGSSQATATTNANGIATWNITITNFGTNHFTIGNATLDIKANGKTNTLVDGSGIQWYANDEIGINAIVYNNDVTVNANSYLIVKNAYSSDNEKIKYCPSTSVYAPTNVKDVFLFVSYLGEMRVINRTSSKITSTNVQGTLTFMGKAYH